MGDLTCCDTATRVRSEPRQMVRNEKRGGGTDYQRRKCAGDAARQPGTGNMPSHVNLQCLETNGTMWRWFQRAELTGLEGTTRDHGSELVALDRPLIALYKPVRFLSLHFALAEVRGREFGGTWLVRSM